MLQNFSSIPAKLCITLLLWAHTLGMAMAKKIIVDDTETDKIVYSKGWTENHGCPGCPEHLRQSPVYNSTWHRHVRYKSDNWLVLINLRQWGEDSGPQWKYALQFYVHRSVLTPYFHKSHHMTPARDFR